MPAFLMLHKQVRFLPGWRKSQLTCKTRRAKLNADKNQTKGNQMFTRDDLTIEPDFFGRDSSIWERVTVSDGRKFLVGSCDLSGPDALDKADAETQLLFLLGALPLAETWVMEAKVDEDGNWLVANECNEKCREGVCKKRLASNTEVASQTLGYDMLLNALNA